MPEQACSEKTLLKPKLIIGLGNPGGEYLLTRHNAGAIVLEEVCRKTESSFEKNLFFNSMVSKNTWQQQCFLQVFPQTYMNLSGKAIAPMMKHLGLKPTDILVCHDFLDLQEGRLKFKFGGSAGGHRGIESIIQELGTDQFARLRIGIGRPQDDQTVVDFVLSSWTLEEQEKIHPMFLAGAEAVLEAVTKGLDYAMNHWNNWQIH